MLSNGADSELSNSGLNLERYQSYCDLLVSDVLKRMSCSAVRLFIFETIDECLEVERKKTSLLQEIRSEIEASGRKIRLNLLLLEWLLCILFIVFYIHLNVYLLLLEQFCVTKVFSSLFKE